MMYTLSRLGSRSQIPPGLRFLHLVAVFFLFFPPALSQISGRNVDLPRLGLFHTNYIGYL